MNTDPSPTAPPSPARKDLLQPVDEKSRALARRLMRGMRHAALAVLEPGSGHPLASRTALGTDLDGAPTILISGLAAHTAALAGDARCSLLIGEPGRGDPLAHPRITVIGAARRIDPDTDEHLWVRRRYLARHPKAALYADLGDFAFWRIEPARASLNGGFGRAYALSTEDLLSPIDEPAAFARADARWVERLNRSHAQTLARIAGSAGGDPGQPWQATSVDADGLELACGDDLRRVAFTTRAGDAATLDQAIEGLLAAAGA